MNSVSKTTFVTSSEVSGEHRLSDDLDGIPSPTHARHLLDFLIFFGSGAVSRASSDRFVGVLSVQTKRSELACKSALKYLAGF